MNSVDRVGAFDVSVWVVNLCTFTWCINSSNLVVSNIWFEVLGMVGCVAWVMAILLNCFEIIVKEVCELSTAMIKHQKERKTSGLL